MALKAGRVGVAPDQVDEFGHINSEATEGYTKQEADAKFETKTNAASTYETKSDAANLQPKTLSVPIRMLNGSVLTVEQGFAGLADALTNKELTDQKVSYANNGVLGAKNFLKHPYYYSEASREINGVIYTNNSDGSVTMNGTASARSLFYLQQSLVIPRGTYTFTKGVTQSSDFGVVIEGYNNGAWAKNLASSYATDAQTFDVDYDGYTEVRFTLAVENGKRVDNVTVYPLLRLASDPDSTYKPYTMTNQQITDLLNVKEGSFTDVVGTLETYASFIKKDANVVSFALKLSGVTAAADATIAKVPDGFRPVAATVYILCKIVGDDKIYIGQITTGGNVSITKALDNQTVTILPSMWLNK